MSPSHSKTGKYKRKKDAIVSTTTESEEHPTFPSFSPTFPKKEEINMTEKLIESDYDKVETLTVSPYSPIRTYKYSFCVNYGIS